jgi:hypothetical protein
MLNAAIAQMAPTTNPNIPSTLMQKPLCVDG